ncbi:MAG: glycosyltransferase family 4 protein [Paracoccaceae bacterium]
MRIVEICTNFRVGGIQRHAVELAGWLRTRGHHVRLAGEPGDYADAASEPEIVALPLNSVAMSDRSIAVRVYHALRCAVRLRKVLKSGGIDLVHAHETAPALIARLATAGLGIPVAFSFHGAEQARLDSVARIARHCSDLAISPSRATLQMLIDRGVPASRARVVGLGVGPHLPGTDADVAALRSELMAGRPGILVLSLSRLDRQKGIDIMIEVARRVMRVRQDVVFAVAGHGPQADEVETWVANAGVGENFRFLGRVDNVATHLAAADIFLLTSRWEALPISIVEAFRAGLPVIATDCGGVRELVSPEVGRLCDVGDVEALSGGVLELAGDEGLRNDLGAQALALSGQARFSPDHVNRQFEEIYAELVAGRK